MRCDYCEYRNSWDCEDYKVSDSIMCDNFKLNYDTLNEKEKREIQKRLMNDTEEYW